MTRKASNKSDSAKPTAAEAPARAPVTQLPDRTPKLTLERAFNTRMGDPLVQAFIAEQRAKGSVRRLTRAEWTAEYNAFLAAPRS